MLDVKAFRASDGVTIAYHHLSPGDGVDVGMPPVFLIHGLASDSRTSWIEPGTTRALVDADRRVFAVDARGHGLSDKPHDPGLYGETRMSRDLVELWDSLGLEQVDLVGHSMGSVVALIAASSDRRIRRLVISGVGRYQLNYDGGPLPHFDSEGFAAALSVDDPTEISDRGLREFRYEIDESGGDRHALAAHLRVLHKDPLALGRIEAPTLVIAGRDDTLSPEPGLLARAIPRGQAITIPGDHAGAKTTAAFIDAVAAFLNQPA
ncbi:MAG TPA: alpha/beta fold hydrolase [Acidimicrobiia bacterium]